MRARDSAFVTAHHRLLLIVILLLAVALRILGTYNDSPPGLAHDEVANWLIDRAILDEGKRGVYFTEAYGHEAGFHYLQAAAVGLVGDNALALRLPAIFAGMLLVVSSYALARRLFGRDVALLAAAFLAVLFWPVFYSRLALRAILLPVVAALSACAWWRGWLGETWPLRWFALAGVLAGLSAYTYMAARALPIFYALLVLYMVLFHRTDFRRRWRGVVVFALLYALVAAPLVVYLQTNPGAEFRISEVDAPLRALLAGDVGPVVENALKIAGMFGVRGDPLWRQNVAGRPVFDPALALLFYAGVVLALWRWRDARYAFVLLWVSTAVTPSLVTVDAPSSIRMINVLPVLTLFPALVIHTISKLSTVIRWFSTELLYFLAGIFVLYHIWWTGMGIFHTWPQNDEVQFVWQAALTETAVYLDHTPDADPTAIGGWSPATMDPPTLAVSMRRDDLALRYFGTDSQTAPVTTVIIPAAPAGRTVRVTHPAARTLHPALADQLAALGGAPQVIDSFVLYVVPQPLPLAPTVASDVALGDELRLLGYDILAAEGGQTVVTYWQVLASPGEPRRFFLHGVDAEGNLVTQHDGLDAPAQYWQPGDVLLQVHPLAETAVPITLRLGVYNPQSGVRLLTGDGRDFVTLPR